MNTDIYISKFHEEAFSGILSCLENVNPTALDENHIVIVPDRYTLSIEKLIYGRLKNKGSFNINVLTLKRLARMLAPDSRYLSQSGAVMLVRKAVKKLAPELVCYGKASRFTGFSKSVYKEICLFKNLMLTPADLLKTASCESGEIAARLSDLSKIYTEYETLTNGIYIDSEGYLRLIAENCKNSSICKNSCFYIVGFDFFTKAEAKCIEEIALNCKKITFAVSNSETLNCAEETAKKRGDKITKYNIDGRRDSVSQFVYNNISVYPLKRYGRECDRIRLFALGSTTEETENAAQQILNDINKGMRFKDICVVLSSIDDYVYPLDKIFKKYNIPYYISENASLCGEPLYKALMNLLAAATDNCPTLNVLSFVKNSCFGADKLETELFENYCHKFGIDRSRFEKPFLLSDNDAEMQTAEKIRLKLVSFLDILKNENQSVIERVRSVVNILTETQEKQGYKALSENGYPDEEAYRKQAFEKINKLIDEIAEINSGELELKEFNELIGAGANSVKLSIIPVSADTVNCGGFDLPKYLNAKAIYILGATEGKFPDCTPENHMLNYGEINDFSAFSSFSFSPVREHERIKLLLSSEGKLNISCSLSDSGGKEKRPSEYFLKLKNMFSLKVSTSLEYSLKRGAAPVCNYSKTISCGKTLFFSGGLASISALETYFSCPKKFLYHYGFFAMPKKDNRLKSLDKGIFLHAVTELFVKSYKKYGNADKTAAECFEKIRSREEYLRYKGDAFTQGAFARLYEETIRTCKAIARGIDESDFVPTYIEASFDSKGKFPLIELLVKDRQIYLRGKIDRADLYSDGENYIRVIDYKSGNASYEEKSLYFGTKLQLFVYMYALRQNGFTPAGVYYFPVNDKLTYDEKDCYLLQGITLNEEKLLFASDKNIGKQNESVLIKLKLKSAESGYQPNANLISRVDFQSYLDYAMLICAKAAEEIDDGNVAMSPVAKTCSYCDYSNICALHKNHICVRKQNLKNPRATITEVANG